MRTCGVPRLPVPKYGFCKYYKIREEYKNNATGNEYGYREIISKAEKEVEILKKQDELRSSL